MMTAFPEHEKWGAVMNEMTAIQTGTVELFPALTHDSVVSGELGKLMDIIKASCPEATSVRFDFDGKLRVHIDVRSRDEIAVIESVLPTLGGGGLFYGLTLGATPHRPFHHRITAFVDR